MQTVGAAFKAWSAVVALSWAAIGFAAPAGTESAVLPQHGPPALSNHPESIALSRQQSNLAGTCGGSAFDVNTLIQVDMFASADVKVTAPGVGLIEEFTDETGANIGPFSAGYPTFHILPFGGGLAPNTPITINITTYSGPNLTGKVSFDSSITFNCTTGAILGPRFNAAAIEPIPSLSPFALAATAALLALLGAVLLRRPARRRSARR